MQTLLSNLEFEDLLGKPTTEVPGYQFNSYCKFGDDYLSCSGDKLCKIEGSDFDGVDIDSELVISSTDLGSREQKRIEYFLYNGEADGDMEVQVTFDNGTPLPEVTIPTGSGSGLQNVLTKMAEGATGTIVSFNVKNTEGCGFSINSLSAFAAIDKIF